MLRLENITKVYATDLVLKNISWEIKKGEKIGLIGSNGAGKTTQLKILMGEEEQTSGSIIKEGKPRISYLKQEFDLKMNNTVRDELISAFEEIQLISEKINSLEVEMLRKKDSRDAKNLNALVNQVGQYQREFEDLGGYQIQAKVDKILPVLGFSQGEANELVPPAVAMNLSWEEYVDDVTGRSYVVNPLTGESCWKESDMEGYNQVF